MIETAELSDVAKSWSMAWRSWSGEGPEALAQGDGGLDVFDALLGEVAPAASLDMLQDGWMGRLAPSRQSGGGGVGGGEGLL